MLYQYIKGSQTLLSNYRPISLLSNLNKIFDKIIFKRLHCFLEKYNCIYELQYGFRAKHSTTHVLHKRKQSLIINGYESEIQILNHGVSQESVLGPLLFLIYINDLHKIQRYIILLMIQIFLKLVHHVNNYRNN